MTYFPMKIEIDFLLSRSDLELRLLGPDGVEVSDFRDTLRYWLDRGCVWLNEIPVSPDGIIQHTLPEPPPLDEMQAILDAAQKTPQHGDVGVLVDDPSGQKIVLVLNQD